MTILVEQPHISASVCKLLTGLLCARRDKHSLLGRFGGTVSATCRITTIGRFDNSVILPFKYISADTYFTSFTSYLSSFVPAFIEDPFLFPSHC